MSRLCLSSTSGFACVVLVGVAGGDSMSQPQAARRTSNAMLETSMLSGDTHTDRGRAVLVLGKQVMHSHRGVPWQLYCQVCTICSGVVLRA
jgi:hypothetical protein